MSKFSKIAAGIAVMPILAFTAPVLADSPGQLTSGSNVVVVKDVTQNGSYSSSVSPVCGDEIKYSVMLHNAAYGGLTNVEVKADLSNGSVTAVPAEGATYGTSGSVNVTLPSGGSLAYTNGSTVLYGQSGNVIETLPDTITSSGVNIGNIQGSTTEFVNFEAKVNCPAPVTPVYTCDALTVTAGDNKTVTVSGLKTTAQNGATFSNATINWGDNSASTTANNVAGQTHTYSGNGTYTITATANFTVNGKDESATSDACKQVVAFSSTTPPTVTPPTTPTPPAQLVNTGAGNTIGIFAAVVAVSTIAYRFVLGRRLSRQ